MMKERPKTCLFVGILLTTTWIPVGIFLTFVLGSFFFLFSLVLVLQCGVIAVALTALMFAISGPFCFALSCTLVVYLVQRLALWMQYILVTCPPKHHTAIAGIKRQSHDFMNYLRRTSVVKIFVKPTAETGKEHDPVYEDRPFDNIAEVDSREALSTSPVDETSDRSLRIARYIGSRQSSNSLEYYDAHDGVDDKMSSNWR